MSGPSDDGFLPAGQELVLQTRTDHSLVRIERDPVRRSGRLVFSDGVACSYIDLDDPSHLEFSYVRRFADIIAAVRPPPAPLRVTHVGGGAVSLARHIADTRPRSTQVVYEYDGALIDLARRHLGLVTFPGLRVKIGDARTRMDRRSAGSADVVVGDAFVGREVPGPLSGLQYTRKVADVLDPDGFYLLNVIGGPDLDRVRRHAATLLAVFRTVLVSADPDVLAGRVRGNVVFLAARCRPRELPLGAIVRTCTSGPYPDRVIRPEEVAAFTGGAVPLPG